MSLEFSLPIRVYIEDTDAGGIVYYANYLKFMERARTEQLRQLGFQQQSLIAEGYLFVVHSLELTYLKSARIDDQLIATVSVKQARRASLIFEQTVVHQESAEVLCRGTVKVACVDAQTQAPKAMPAAMLNIFQA